MHLGFIGCEELKGFRVLGCFRVQVLQGCNAFVAGEKSVLAAVDILAR